jgi:hypothetical protein
MDQGSHELRFRESLYGSSGLELLLGPPPALLREQDAEPQAVQGGERRRQAPNCAERLPRGTRRRRENYFLHP